MFRLLKVTWGTLNICKIVCLRICSFQVIKMLSKPLQVCKHCSRVHQLHLKWSSNKLRYIWSGSRWSCKNHSLRWPDKLFLIFRTYKHSSTSFSETTPKTFPHLNDSSTSRNSINCNKLSLVRLKRNKSFKVANLPVYSRAVSRDDFRRALEGSTDPVDCLDCTCSSPCRSCVPSKWICWTTSGCTCRRGSWKCIRPSGHDTCRALTQTEL